MRRLLIRLVAVETMLVGWLSYWIFLVYANNPAVGAGLGEQLSKFPQLAFTTIDLAVLVVIAILSIGLAFKFYRGLRPGIRLERALQMLENLMKRNLVLEAQVAELRVEKAEKISSRSLPSVSGGLGLRGSGFAVAAESSPAEPRQGSWEKAFRTPLEAGSPTAKVSRSNLSEAPFQHETGIPPSRTEEAVPNTGPAKPVMAQAKTAPANVSGHVEEKVAETKKTPAPLSMSGSAGWEESPKYVGEATGILEPSNAIKKASLSTVDSTGQKQPYIPVPATRTTPSSVIVGPMNQKPSPTRLVPRPIVRPPFSNKISPKEFSSPSSADVKPPSSSIVSGKKESQTDSKPVEQAKPSVATGEEETREKPKLPFVFKKKFPDMEHS